MVSILENVNILLFLVESIVIIVGVIDSKYWCFNV